MKLKIAALMLCLAIPFSLAACQSSSEAEEASAVTQSAEATTDATTDAPKTPTVSLGVTSAFVIDENNYKDKLIPTEYEEKCFGVYVSDGIQNSDLFKSGFRRGDIIHAIDGKDVRALEDVTEILCDYQIGDSAVISVFRYDIIRKEGTAFEVTVTFTDPNAETAQGTTQAATQAATQAVS